MKIVVDKQIPFIRGVLDKYAQVVYLEGGSITRNQVLEADALVVRTRTKCNAALLEGTKVRFIATATIGYDHIDVDFCRANQIHWTNAAGSNSSSVQQYVAATLFQLAHKLHFDLARKTIGIVGVGNVGTKVAKLCNVLGMHVLLNDPPRERREGPSAFVSLNAIVEQADIITLHVPLSYEGEDKTFHLADEKFLSRLQPDQTLINTSRGEVADSNSLKIALKGRKLAACVLDVWENEPKIDLELLDLVDIGTPHIAGYSAEGKANATAMSVQAVSRFFGLGIDSWFPEKVPLPSSANIEVDCKNLSQQEVIGKLIERTYDISLDDLKLRKSPGTFEKQRADYPLRREFPAYTVKLLNTGDNIRQLIQKVGFNVLDP
jgi:erythronate-4-phosphate dehydrogenase